MTDLRADISNDTSTDGDAWCRQHWLQLGVPPPMRAQLAREATEHGVELAAWALLKLSSPTSGYSPTGKLSLPRVARWKTRC